jgi:pimeloyl-ACP methyl ester carboxylesterase
LPFASNGVVQLYYEDHGSGAPIIFVHEFAGDVRSWAPQIHGLSRRFRCIAFNARGYPPSSVPEMESDYGYEKAVDDVRIVMDTCKLDSAHIVGLSMGGYAAMSFAITHPARTRSAVIAAAGSGSDPEGRPAYLEESAQLADRLEQLGMVEGIAKYAHSPSREPLKEKDPLGFAEFLRNFSEHSAKGSARTLRGFQIGRPTIYSWDSELKRMQVPALIIVGDRDAACVRPSFFLRNRLPNSRLAVMPNTGHCANLEEPAIFNHFVEELVSGEERRRGAK